MASGRHSRPASLDLAPIVRRFESSVPDVAKAITDLIWAEIPGYSGLGASERAEVQEAAHRNVSAFVRALGEGRDLSKRDIDALGAVGEQRAKQGIPLEDVLRAFRMVGRVLWEHISREMTGADSPPMEVALELGGTLMKFTDQISSSVAHHYSVAQRAIIRQQEAARREFLHDLLFGSYTSVDEMMMGARGFGYDLARPHIAVVASSPKQGRDPVGDELSLTRALDRIAESVGASGQPMVGRRGSNTIGLIAVAPGAQVKAEEFGKLVLEELDEGWKLGVGGPYAGSEGCRRSYLEAGEAIEIGQILYPDDSIFPFETFLLYRFLRTDAGLVERFVEAVLGRLIDHDRRRRSELVKTLEAYFGTDLSAKDTGKKLYAHPHTITYRLRQIEKLTGRSLKDPEDKLHLHLAVKALRISRQLDTESPVLMRASS